MELLPREKLIKYGVDKLEDYELLAIMLGTGIKGENVFELAKRLCNTYGFERLYKMKYEELSKIPGIKEAKASKLISVFEIVRRIMESHNSSKTISNSKELFDYIYPKYMSLTKEVLTIVYVSSSLGILNIEEYSNDSYSEILTPIKTIIKNSIANDAYGIFIVHNHPGGNPNPSDSDIRYTYQLDLALKAINILLLDHIIIAKNKYYSFNDNGSTGNPFDF